MRWCLDLDCVGLQLVHATDEEADQVRGTIADFGACGVDAARVRAGRIDEAFFQNGRLDAPELESLAKWCHTAGQYARGRPHAERLADLFFRQVPPRREGQLLNWLVSFCDEAQIHRCNGDGADMCRVADESVVARVAGLPAEPRDDDDVRTATHGSQFCLQRYVNEAPRQLADLIVAHSSTLLSLNPRNVEWLSPLRAEGYYEYRDDVLNRLGLGEHHNRRREFWPDRGPQWDALANVTTQTGRAILLIEAKAHPGELKSHCGAGEVSKQMIERAFGQVQDYMGLTDVSPAVWCGDHYQTANRLAYLYLFNELLNVPAWLVFLNFVDDYSYRPTCLETWRAAYQRLFGSLGLRPNSPLLDKVITLFVPPLPPALP